MDKSDNPGSPRALDPAAEARSLVASGRPKEAENVIRTALQVEKDSYRTSSFYSLLGWIWSTQKRTREAEEAFRHAVFLLPMYPESHALLGQFLLKHGELREAEAEMRAAIKLKPQASSYHSGLAAVLLEQCFFDDAHASLRRAIRLDRRNTGALEMLAKLLAAKRDYRGAERALKKARAINPNSASALWALASLLEQQGKIDEVVACKKKILELDPNNPHLGIQFSDQFRKFGRLDDAERAIRAALALRPRAAAYCVLSQILEAQSRTTEGIAAMREARKLDPENKAHQARLEKLAASCVIPAEVSDTRPNRAESSERRNLAAPPVGALARIRLIWSRIKSN